MDTAHDDTHDDTHTTDDTTGGESFPSVDAWTWYDTEPAHVFTDDDTHDTHDDTDDDDDMDTYADDDDRTAYVLGA